MTMSELRDLYQELIIDHGRKPRNFGELSEANFIQEGYNPLCGDRLTVFLQEENGLIKNVQFTGIGCAISMASASLMTESLKGKSVNEAQQLFEKFHRLVTGTETHSEDLGKLMALAGVAEFPARVKCATLCWHTIAAAIKGSREVVSTE